MSATRAMSSAAPAARRAAQPLAGLTFDWIIVVLSGWLIGGLYLDGWAHHQGVLDTFFTPWHAALYSGYLAVTVALVVALLRNHVMGLPWRRALPAGYGLSLIGAVVYLAGGLGDMVWHIAFGIETDLGALLSPTHLVLLLGGILIASGPLRAAWLRPGTVLGDNWISRLPALMPAASACSSR